MPEKVREVGWLYEWKTYVLFNGQDMFFNNTPQTLYYKGLWLFFIVYDFMEFQQNIVKKRAETSMKSGFVNLNNQW